MELYMTHKLTQMADTRDHFLSASELGALSHIARGLQTTEVARELDVSEEAVNALLGDAQAKLGAANRINAVAIAIRLGLIGIEA
jgi:DNA-binding CsgD family transcriptional regulator